MNSSGNARSRATMKLRQPLHEQRSAPPCAARAYESKVAWRSQVNSQLPTDDINSPICQRADGPSYPSSSDRVRASRYAFTEGMTRVKPITKWKPILIQYSDGASLRLRTPCLPNA